MSNMIRQMRLVSGEEIVCEVVDFDDEDGPAIVIRNALKIETINRMDGHRVHIFRPWMIFQVGEDIFQTLNGDMVLAEASPADEVLKEYYRSIKSENDEEPSDEQLEDYIQKLRDAISNMTDGDSDSIASKIIQFPGSTKIH